MICSKHLERKIIGCLWCRLDLREDTADAHLAEIQRLTGALERLHSVAQDIYNEKDTNLEKLAKQLQFRLMVTQDNYNELTNALIAASEVLEQALERREP